MKEVEFFRWQTPPPPGKRAPVRTRYVLTVEEAAERLPGAVPVPGSREVRILPETREELAAGMNASPHSANPETRAHYAQVMADGMANLKRIPTSEN